MPTANHTKQLYRIVQFDYAVAWEIMPPPAPARSRRDAAPALDSRPAPSRERQHSSTAERGRHQPAPAEPERRSAARESQHQRNRTPRGDRHAGELDRQRRRSQPERETSRDQSQPPAMQERGKDRSRRKREGEREKRGERGRNNSKERQPCRKRPQKPASPKPPRCRNCCKPDQRRQEKARFLFCFCRVCRIDLEKARCRPYKETGLGLHFSALGIVRNLTLYPFLHPSIFFILPLIPHPPLSTTHLYTFSLSLTPESIFGKIPLSTLDLPIPNLTQKFIFRTFVLQKHPYSTQFFRLFKFKQKAKEYFLSKSY